MHVKVGIVGDSGVGKTSILHCWKNGNIDDITPTVMCSNYCVEMTTDNGKVCLDVYDTAGSEQYQSLISRYLRDVSVVIIVFEINTKSTFTNVKYWLELVENEVANIPDVFIVGNKSDLDGQREVTFTEARSWAEDHECEYYETSSKTNSGISELFTHIANSVDPESVIHPCSEHTVSIGSQCEKPFENPVERKTCCK